MIPENFQQEMEEFMLGWEFPWFHYANTNYASTNTADDDTPQFCHGFFRDDQSNSKFMAIPMVVLKSVGVTQDQIIRVKANLMTREPEQIVNPRHTDDEQEHIVLIYYINDSDGDTHIWLDDGSVEKVSPKRGRGVLFPGHLLHASSTPVDHRYRMVLNFNLKSGAVDLS